MLDTSQADRIFINLIMETILQHWIVTQFILPFALITGLVYGILEKTKLLGDEKHQLNAILAFIIGLY